VAVAFLIILSVIGVSASATSVTIASVHDEVKYAILTYVYYLISSTVTTTTPSTNTALTPPGGSGSHNLLIGSSAYLWSTQFLAATTISSGNWLLDLWASSLLGGSMTVSIYITDSSGAVQSTIVNGGTTNAIGASNGQVATSFSGSQVSVPSNGYIEVVLTIPAVSTMTLYWGVAQLTNFQVPKTVLS
jgi:hypothetical protein